MTEEIGDKVIVLEGAIPFWTSDPDFVVETFQIKHINLWIYCLRGIG